jgi:Flp pilus assembly protein TadG
MSAPRLLNRFIALLSSFRHDKRANIAVIFAIALVLVMTAMGCAIDYTLAVRLKSKLQPAADAASVASISAQSAGYIAATAMASNGSVPAGVTDPNNVFAGNMTGVRALRSRDVSARRFRCGSADFCNKICQRGTDGLHDRPGVNL